MTELKTKPKLSSNTAQKQLDEAENQFQSYDENIKQMTLDRMNEAPAQESEPQTKISQVDREKMKDVYLKPYRTISSREKFNEKFRDDYNFSKEYVQFEAENIEIIGEELQFWTKPFPGVPAEEWKVPVNKPLWGPRYVAERIKGCKYHRMTMQQTIGTGNDQMGQYYGAMAVDKTIQRLDARPVSTRKSIFMGGNF